MDDGIITDPRGSHLEGLKVVAQGDVDNDRHVDLITVNSDLDHFTVQFWDPVNMTYHSSNSFTVDTMAPNPKIASIVVSKDKRPLQSLYVMYWKDFTTDSTVSVKVFEQFRRGFFREYQKHSLNGLTLYSSTQPFFLDLNGDMM